MDVDDFDGDWLMEDVTMGLASNPSIPNSESISESDDPGFSVRLPTALLYQRDFLQNILAPWLVPLIMEHVFAICNGGHVHDDGVREMQGLNCQSVWLYWKCRVKAGDSVGDAHTSDRGNDGSGGEVVEGVEGVAEGSNCRDTTPSVFDSLELLNAIRS